MKKEAGDLPVGIFRPAIGWYFHDDFVSSNNSRPPPFPSFFIFSVYRLSPRLGRYEKSSRPNVNETVILKTAFLVISTYREPVRGWIDNLYGPTGVAAGAGTGILRSIHCDGSKLANVVPGDLTVNALIACAWDVANRYKYVTRSCFYRRREFHLRPIITLSDLCA